MRTPLIVALTALAVTAFASVAWAELIIDVGDHELLPNAANQQITIDVHGGDAVEGATVFLQVADGGPEAGGTISGPHITNADILTATIFAGNNQGDFGGTVVPQVWQSITLTQSGTVAADGLLATVTLDTTGFNSGSWGFLMESGLGVTEFGGVPLTIHPGTLYISGGEPGVPEPASCVLLLLGSAAGLLFWRSR